MLHSVFSGGGGGWGSPLTMVTGFITLMLLLMSDPIYGSANANLNLTFNMVLAPKQQTSIRFGSSVAFWRTGNNMQLVVGAPLTPYEIEHKNISYPLGNIYLCSLKGQCYRPYHGLPSLYPEDDNQCVNHRNDCKTKAENKWACEKQQTDMMKNCPLACNSCDKQTLDFAHEYLIENGIGLGETLSFTSLNGTSDTTLLVCAPRFLAYFTPIKKSIPHSFMSRGACFRMTDSHSVPDRILPFKESFIRVRPGSQKKNNEHYNGFGMAGFSAAFAEDDTVFMGSPNTYYGQGSLSSRNFITKPKVPSYHFNKKVYSSDQSNDYNREGWAIALGKFNSETGLEYVATSIPHEDNAFGKIQFYRKSFEKEEPGISDDDSTTHGFNSKYGYALAVGDLDNDGNEDLIVGAPFAKGSKGVVEGGKVFVYYGPLNNKVDCKTQIIEGPAPWLRFGSAVVSDDFNHDGYYDIAVGAPFDAQGWAGAVYIYMGSRDGLCEKTGGICNEPDQLICASDFNPPNNGSSGNYDIQYTHALTSTSSKHCKKLPQDSSPSPLVSLGFSLATADIDRNGYPDLLIGAPKADKAILIRSAPVVELDGAISFDPREIKLGNKTCVVDDIEDSEKTVCFKLKIRIFYRSHELKIRNLQLMCKIELDYEVSQKRILFESNNQDKINWRVTATEEGESTEDKELEVYVRAENVETDKPITARLEVKLEGNQTQENREGMDELAPILYKPEYTFEERGYLLCQDKSKCYSQPNVKMMKFKSMEIVVDGTYFKVHAIILVLEDYALGIKLNITHPKVLTLQERAPVNLTKTQQNPKYMYQDVRMISETLHNIRVEERIKINTTISVELAFKYEPEDLMMYLKEEGTNIFDIDFSVSTSGDVNLTDNKEALRIEALTDLSLSVYSNLKNETYQVNPKSTFSLSQLKEASNNSEETVLGDQLGPAIEYKIVITNKGPAFMHNAQVTFDLPLWTPELPLFYVTEQLTSEGAHMECDHITINPSNFNFKDDSFVEREQDKDTMDDNTVEEGNSHERNKRSADLKTSVKTDSNGTTSIYDSPHSREMDCSQKDACHHIRCTVSYLAPDKNVVITLKNSRIVIPTLLKFRPEIKEYQVPVLAKVITQQQRENKGETITKTHTLITIVQERVTGLKDLPWWYFLLAILGGILLILLFSYCLFKAGFFKRNRPPMASSGVKTDSATKIVEENEDEPEGKFKFDEGMDNPITENTPLNQRKEIDSDAAVV